MTVRAAAHRWTCSRCGVAVGQIDGHEVQLPQNWESCAEGDFCLSCRRGRAAEAAGAAVAEGAGGAEQAQARRAGLIEFEVQRTPDRTNATIARACRTTASTVAAARRRLHMCEAPPPGSDSDWAATRTAGAR